MTTLNTTSQIQMPRTLESRSYLTGKTKEEANAVIPPPKQQQTATQTDGNGTNSIGGPDYGSGRCYLH